MAENKIPVLTEVYKPKKSTKTKQSVEVTAELLAEVAVKVRPEVETSIMGELRSEIAKLREELTASSSDDEANASLGELTEKVVAQVRPRLESEITDYVLDELRPEINKAREQVIASTQDFVDKSKADLKTELPKMYQESIQLAESNINERFESLQKLQEELVSRHQTELNESLTSLQKSVGDNIQEALREELSKIQEKAIQDHQQQLNEALDGFLQIKGENAEKTLMQEMQKFQDQVRVDYQEKVTGELTTALETITQRVEESTEEQIDVMHTQVGTLQQESFSKLREAFNAEKDDVFSSASKEIKDTLTLQMSEKSQEISDEFFAKINGELPDVQAVLQDSVHTILDKTAPEIEGRLRTEITDELHQLLLKVKFVLPE